MSLQDLNQRFPIVNPDGTPSDYFMRLLRGKDEALSAAVPATRQIIAGLGLTGGGPLSADVTIDADVQAILDEISSTHGDILFRGAAGWEVLAAGTAGYVLSTNGAGADPTWIAGGGGGGANYFDNIGLPVPAVGDFTLSQAAAFSGTAAVNDIVNGVSLSGTNNTFAHAVAEIAITPTTGDFAVTAALKLGYRNVAAWGMGIYLKDNAGKRYSWGFRNSEQWRFAFSSLTDFGSVVNMGGGPEVYAVPVLYRLRKTGSTMFFEVALDSKNFVVVFSESATAYLTSTISAYGIEISPNNTFQSLTCYGLQGL